MKTILLPDLVEELADKGLYFTSGFKVHDEYEEEQFNLEVLPGCCGGIVMHHLDPHLQLERATDLLLELLDKKISKGSGASRIFATTSNREGFITSDFEEDGRWTRLYDWYNTGADANKITMWVLEPKN